MVTSPYPSPQKTPEPARVPDRPARVLVADDEHLVAAQIALMLADLGHTVVGPATDAAGAVELARVSAPDMAVLDIRMPGGDGLAAAKEIFLELAVPVVILSAYADEEYARAAQDAGVFGYLIKPVTPDQLSVGVTVAWGRFKRYMGERAENEYLKRKLEERRLVEQAKWLLVSKRGIGEPEAMKMLQRRARDTRQALGAVAEAVLRAGEMV